MSAECSAGNIPPGYKQTEVGVIPEDWDVCLLDSVANRGSGHTPDKSHPEYWGGNIKWISLQDSDRLDKLYIYDTAAKITPLGIKNSSAKMHLEGTVVLSRDAGVGKSAIMKEDMAVSQHFIAWKCGPLLNNHFLYYWLQSNKSEFERIAMGSTIKTIGLPYFRRLSIPLPTIGEQEAIGEALSDADAFIESLEQLIAKKRQIKQGAMQEFLTGKRRIPKFVIKNGYKHTEAGTIPEDWSSICYADYLNILSGLGFKKAEYCDIGIRLLRIDNVSYGKISWDSVVYLPLQYTEKFPNLVLSEGDILLALNRPVTNNQLKLARLNAEDSPAILYQRVGKIEVINSKLDKTFAYFILRKFIRKFVEESSVGSDQPFVSTTALKKIHIPLPPTLAEQEAIATILSDMDSEITALEEKLAKARQIKQGMMQELLTGRIRLV